MALVNMSNKFYYFRRVTAAGTVPGGVCLPELPWGTTQGNYVVDVDYATKEPGQDAYNFPLFRVGSESSGGIIDEAAREQWYMSSIPEVLGTDKENDQYTGNYKIWRYVTENTVNNTGRMTAGLSTGIVFKGKMVPTDAARTSTDEHIVALAKVLDYDMTDASLNLNHNTHTDPILYAFGGNLYMRWPNIRKAALAAATLEDGTVVYTNSFYEAVFGKNGAQPTRRVPITCGRSGITATRPTTICSTGSRRLRRATASRSISPARTTTRAGATIATTSTGTATTITATAALWSRWSSLSCAITSTRWP